MAEKLTPEEFRLLVDGTKIQTGQQDSASITIRDIVFTTHYTYGRGRSYKIIVPERLKPFLPAIGVIPEKGRASGIVCFLNSEGSVSSPAFTTGIGYFVVDPQKFEAIFSEWNVVRVQPVVSS